MIKSIEEKVVCSGSNTQASSHSVYFSLTGLLMPISWDFPLWVSTPRLWATCLPWGRAANAGGYKGCLLPSAPVTL